MDSDFYFQGLKGCIQNLTLDAVQQRDYLKKLFSQEDEYLKIWADELALEFDYYFTMIDQFKEDACIPEKAIKSMYSLDAYLDEISGEENELLWTDEALFEAKEWEHVRFLAGRCLKGLGED